MSDIIHSANQPNQMPPATKTNFKEQAIEAFNSAAKTLGRVFPTAGGTEGTSQQLKLAASITAWGGVSVLTAGAFPIGWLMGIGIGTCLTKVLVPKEGSKADNTSVEKIDIPPSFTDDKAMLSLSRNVNKQLTRLKADNPKYRTAEVKESIDRLELLQNEIRNNPNSILEKMKKNQGEDLYRYMQPVKFMSMLVQSDHNMSVFGGNPHGLNDLERVALYRYTTGDYRNINQEAREAKKSGKEIEDPSLRAYYNQTTAALSKLPNASLINESGERVQLKRSYFKPVNNSEWEKFDSFVNTTFVKGNTFDDGSFLSTTSKLGATGVVNVTFEFPDDAKEIPNGKSIGPPYSAFKDEGEILFMPGTVFKISNVEKQVSEEAVADTRNEHIFVVFTPIVA